MITIPGTPSNHATMYLMTISPPSGVVSRSNMRLLCPTPVQDAGASGDSPTCPASGRTLPVDSRELGASPIKHAAVQSGCLGTRRSTPRVGLATLTSSGDASALRSAPEIVAIAKPLPAST